MSICDAVGAAVSVHPPGRAGELSREQLRRTRNEDWRRAHEEGVPDLLGRPVKRPVSLIAKLAGVSEQTVRNGIAAAAKLRSAILGTSD